MAWKGQKAGGSKIISRQRLEIASNGVAGDRKITINSIDINNSYVHLYYAKSSNYGNKAIFKLQDSTTLLVQVQKPGSTGDISFILEIIEYDNIKQKIENELLITGGSYPISIDNNTIIDCTIRYNDTKTTTLYYYGYDNNNLIFSQDNVSEKLIHYEILELL